MTVKKKILLVGEHPESFTGNGHMMAELVKHIDRTKFDFSVFAVQVVSSKTFSIPLIIQ